MTARISLILGKTGVEHGDKYGTGRPATTHWGRSIRKMASLVNARSVLYRLFPRLRPAVPPPAEPQERNIIAASPLFEALWYLEQNPDVAAAGMDPALHYFLHGADEGR